MDTYEILLQKYDAALKEIDRLREEIRNLQLSLSIEPNGQDAADENKAIIIDGNVESNIASAVSMQSATDDKIALFRSIFQGRQDVVARRWASQTTGKSGYQPICENEWDPYLCDKRTHKCADCPNRKMTPLSNELIYRHLAGKDLAGRDVIGIYPMLEDETCCFLAADFDDDSFEADVSAYREQCREWDIPVSVERSRSGNGAHAWIFFAEPIQAALARKLGTAILTGAMEKQGTLSFKSYDRLFPNQDFMPSGGFGNLIALPLQGQARRKGNSVFIDDHFKPYEDQWAYLSRIRKMTKDEVLQIAEQHGKHALGDLVKDTEDKPWAESANGIKLSREDFPSAVEIHKANGLYVSTTDFSARAVNALKRLSAFQNPDFYRAQRMRMPVYNKPRIISCYDIIDPYLVIPRGCEEPLVHLLESLGVAYQITDETTQGNPINVSFQGELFEEQQQAADEMLLHDNGVLSATTAFGKTVVASYLIGQKKVSTLVLVQSQALLSQWKKALESFLHFEIEPPSQNPKRGRKTV